MSSEAEKKFWATPELVEQLLAPCDKVTMVRQGVGMGGAVVYAKELCSRTRVWIPMTTHRAWRPCLAQGAAAGGWNKNSNGGPGGVTGSAI